MTDRLSRSVHSVVAVRPTARHRARRPIADGSADSCAAHQPVDPIGRASTSAPQQGVRGWGVLARGSRARRPTRESFLDGCLRRSGSRRLRDGVPPSGKSRSVPTVHRRSLRTPIPATTQALQRRRSKQQQDPSRSARDPLRADAQNRRSRARSNRHRARSRANEFGGGRHPNRSRAPARGPCADSRCVPTACSAVRAQRRHPRSRRSSGRSRPRCPSWSAEHPAPRAASPNADGSADHRRSPRAARELRTEVVPTRLMRHSS